MVSSRSGAESVSRSLVVVVWWLFNACHIMRIRHDEEESVAVFVTTYLTHRNTQQHHSTWTER
jgi:hypothetical protein